MEKEFVLIGVGLNARTSKGAVCPEPEGCPKGVPALRHTDDPAYLHDGYKVIQGPSRPTLLGGCTFGAEADAHEWLEGGEGRRFKAIFRNVYLACVTK